ncbi:Hsp70 family protein [Actinoplanes sp. Pm04-4]|uniref:Hsp70 family protein n=1 Tax=Paractinoplanes pyxinae TaxID=2997416 RepID=A0ABT4BEZ2_9ACTN|nr:FHA domain-containing protein [Actinoplanes pyxinae]MCY1145084.1 Hsp70 family protein [Actinoplanes pyxinae]
MTMPARLWRAGISLGTAHTVTMLRAPGMPPRPVLAGGSPLVPSSADPVYPGHRDPLHAGSLLPQHLARMAVEVRRAAGAETVETTVACPSEWDSSRQAALASAVSRAGLSGVQVVGEAVAAAAALGDRLPSGGTVLVVDAGASSCDVGLVRRTDDGYDQLAFETLDGTGGIRLDTCLAELAGAWIAGHDRGVWHRLEDPLTAVDRAARLLLWEELRALKERLSIEESASFTVPLADTELTVTRTEFEALAQPILARVARTAAGMGGATTLLLVGGGSRIPLLWSLVEAASGLAAVTVKEPELAVAEGCALLPRDFAAAPVSPPVAPVSPPRSPAPQPLVAPAASVRYMAGDGEPVSFGLPRQRRVLIGTAPNADLRLADSYASRRHAEISPSGGRFWVDDLGSTNGTTVNGRRLQGREPLRPGDVIGIGRTRLEFTDTDSPAVPRPVRSTPPERSRGGSMTLLATGAGLAVAGVGWWLISTYAGMVVGLSAMTVGLVLMAVGVARLAKG